jgi:hypothetical protein
MYISRYWIFSKEGRFLPVPHSRWPILPLIGPASLYHLGLVGSFSHIQDEDYLDFRII